MEVWDLYDSNKKVTGKTHIRGEEIPDGYFHSVVHVWIRNKDGQYLISKRSDTKSTYPGLYECVGGSVLVGETSEDGAIRETLEEVGIILQKNSGKIVYDKIRTTEHGIKMQDIMDVWLFEYDGELNLANATTDEVSEIAWMTIDEIKELYEKGVLVPTLEYIFEIHEKLQKTSKNSKKTDKNKKKTKKQSEKTKYFDFYDDIKSSCHKIIDW